MDGSSERLKQARSYELAKQKLALFHLTLTPVLLAAAVVFPLSKGFQSAAFSATGNAYLALAVYFLLLSLYFLVFDLPFAYYAGYRLEHRYGLSNQNLGSWAVFFLKKAFLSFGLSMILLQGLYAFLWRYPSSWWLMAWAAYALVSYVLGKLFPVVVVPLFYRYSPLEDDGLKERIVKLARRYGLPVEQVFVLNLSKTTQKANAAFMGLGRTKRVVLSDTLIQRFSPDEIEVVLAHELGHFRHRDIWRQMGFGLALSFLAFWIASRAVGPLARGLGLGGVEEIAALPVLFLIFYLFGLILTPAQSAFSRWMERSADGFALRAVADPQAFVRCMEKLAEVNLADPEPNRVYEWFFYDHPSLGRRIRMARGEKWKAAP